MPSGLYRMKVNTFSFARALSSKASDSSKGPPGVLMMLFEFIILRKMRFKTLFQG
jgi:hypothetical protein